MEEQGKKDVNQVFIFFSKLCLIVGRGGDEYGSCYPCWWGRQELGKRGRLPCGFLSLFPLYLLVSFVPILAVGALMGPWGLAIA